MSTEPDAELDVDPPADAAPIPSSFDPEHVGGAAFWVGLVIGWTVIIGGIRVGMHDREVKPALLLKWLAGGLILHDVVWLPLLAIAGGIVTFAIRRRVPPFAAWALTTSVVLTLIAWPFVRGYGRRADVPSALQRNYAHGLLVYIGVTWVIAVIAMAIDVRRRRRGTN